MSLSSLGIKGGAVVRALAYHQCGRGSNPGVDTVCGLSLLLVLYIVSRGFCPGTPVFPSPQEVTLPNSNSIWNARTRFNELSWTPKCSVGPKLPFTITTTICWLQGRVFFEPLPASFLVFLWEFGYDATSPRSSSGNWPAPVLSHSSLFRSSKRNWPAGDEAASDPQSGRNTKKTLSFSQRSWWIFADWTT